MEIKIELTPEARQTVERFQRFPQRVLPAIVKAMDAQNLLTVSDIQRNYLSFPKDGPSVPIGCRAQSGMLYGSLRPSKAQITGAIISSAIGSNLEYAAAQEFGSEPHDIYPKSGKALRFKIGERVMYASHVHHPGTKPRGFVQRGITDNLSNYSKSISAAVLKAMQTL